MNLINQGVFGVQGNIHLQERLFRYLGNRRIHPALIFSGAKSTSKLIVIKNAAKMLLCRLTSAQLAYCGNCSTCDRIEREIHPDVWVWKEPDEDVIKVESVRDICHRMDLPPVEGNCRICIMDDCHRMNTASANAFLKTLEEPKVGHYFWLLTAQPGVLPSTLRSRCLEFSFQPERSVPSPERTSEFDALYQDFLRSRDPYRVTHRLREKRDVSDFVDHLQMRLHQKMVSEPSWFHIQGFELLLELEGRLRSNANHGLLLENYLARLQ